MEIQCTDEKYPLLVLLRFILFMKNKQTHAHTIGYGLREPPKLFLPWSNSILVVQELTDDFERC